MAATQELMNEIQVFNSMATAIARALTEEGSATTPLISAGNITALNDVLAAHLAYLESIIPTVVP